MKTLILAMKEFLHFRQVAEMYRITFTYGIKKGQVTVMAAATDLEQIGY